MTVRRLLAATALAMATLTASAHAGAEGETAISVYGLTLGSGLIARTGATIRINNLRKVEPASSWVEEKPSLYAPVVEYTPRYTHWVKYRSPYARVRRAIRVDLRIDTPPPVHNYLYDCRYLADCPCRYLAGC